MRPKMLMFQNIAATSICACKKINFDKHLSFNLQRTKLAENLAMENLISL